MITDPIPRKTERRADYLRSEGMTTIVLPPGDSLRELALKIETALGTGSSTRVRASCVSFLSEAARFYKVQKPQIRVLASRPIQVYEKGSSELFGDYHPRTGMIRVWMRTAVQHRVTSFGTFLSTLCHEFCHHLDIKHFGLFDSPHTRGFYHRTALLYHLCRGTPLRPLIWLSIGRGRYRIDWSRMRG